MTSVHANRKSGEISLRTWTRNQISPICRELLKKLMAKQNVRQRTKTTFNRSLFTKFNQPFNTSKLGTRTSSCETRLVTRETKRKSQKMSQTFAADLVMRVIKRCRNRKSFGQTNLAFSTRNISDLERLNMPTSEPSIFSYYITDIQRPTAIVTVWAT